MNQRGGAELDAIHADQRPLCSGAAGTLPTDHVRNRAGLPARKLNRARSFQREDRLSAICEVADFERVETGAATRES